MPSPSSVRPSAFAAAETTLSHLQDLHLVGREQRLRHPLQERGLHPRDRERYRDEQPAPLDGGEHEFHQLPEVRTSGPPSS